MLRRKINAAAKKNKSDLVITNVQIVDVFSQEIYVADVAVSNGFFAGIGDYTGYGREEVDGAGKFLVPGLIDAHAHIESTLVTPVEYSNVSLPRGITGVVADPHEIANVCGVDGIRFMLKCSRQVPMDIHMMLPSCVPATSFEHSGAVLTADDLRHLYNEEGVLGLAEVMDFSSVFNCDADMVQKLEDALKAGRRIDGHGAGFDIDQLNSYAAAEIRTDHECDTAEGVIERVRRGIYTLIREGTVCRDLLKMIPAINEKNAPMLCFATDDKHLDDIMKTGGVDNNVRMAVANGVDPAAAIQIASLNAARCYKLHNRGAIAPGYHADFSIVSDLEELYAEQVYKDGMLVAENGKMLKRVEHCDNQTPAELKNTVRLPAVTTNDLVIDMEGCSCANIIEIIPGTVVSKHLVEEVDTEEGLFVPSILRDQLKISVIERHGKVKGSSVGIVKGLKLTKGAIATTIAHDSHNLIVVGTNDDDMLAAVERIREMQGGIAIVADGKSLAQVELEIAGIVTARSTEAVLSDLTNLHVVLSALAPECSFNPVLALSFMSLVVIPELKLCDSGLFDFNKFGFIPVPVCDEKGA